MSEQLSFQKICGSDTAHLDLIFIHGLEGSPEETWNSGTPKGDSYWPVWLCEDFPKVRVFALGYPASLFAKWAKKEMTLYERTKNVLEHLASNGIGDRPLGLITHSLGGILAKQILRTANDADDDGWKAIATNTRLVTFLATPHSGASLANILKFFSPRFSSTHVQLLTNESGELDELSLSYRALAPKLSIKTLVYYEKHKLKNVLIVDKVSSDPGVQGVVPIPIDADHSTICKPLNREAVVYKSLCRHLRDLLKKCSPIPPVGAVSSDIPPFEFDDYREASAGDRRDLLQKLVDAGREHEYASANDSQNKFAQRYYRLGLHTEAKNRNDELLAEVEQRFNLHVYQNKICKGANDGEIADAIQHEVIDAVCAKYADESVSPTTVLRAIYFLTEQCHISWNA